MEIKRSELNSKVRSVFEEARDNPVFIKHYNEVTTVLISKKLFDKWEAIVKEHESQKDSMK